jgi:long-subunit fatty acid transport protein
MRDESYLGMTANFDVGSVSDEVVFLPLRYNIRTPGRLSGGAALFLDKLGFISADVEWVDYSSAKLTSNEADFSDVNQEINNYQSVLNYRLGAELRLKALRLRAGYSYQDDPLDNAGGIDRSSQALTAGIGFRLKKFYTDVSYVRSSYNTSVSPYPGAATALTDNISESAVLTLGFKF